MGRILPMLTTAAGTLAPAKVFVIGAGVAGLQAIATARRLGGIVSAFDVRAVVREQVQSLGATFVEVAAVEGGGAGRLREGAGGGAAAPRGGRHRGARQGAGPDRSPPPQIPGRPAPRLITADAVRAMKPGSVIVDLAGESGGNCELTRSARRSPSEASASSPRSTSPRASRCTPARCTAATCSRFVTHLLKDGALQVDLADPITGPMCVTHAGELRTGKAA